MIGLMYLAFIFHIRTLRIFALMIYQENNGPVATVFLQRPNKQNALNSLFLKRIQETFHTLARDESVRLVVLSSALPKTFCAGVDIDELAAFKDREQARSFARLLDETIITLLNFPKPMIARVEGYALGGGLVLAATADIRVMTPSTVVGIPAGRLGTILPSTLTRVLQHLTSSGNLKDLLLTGRRVTAREAVAMGLARFMVEADQCDAHIRMLAREILKSPDQALALSKMMLNEPLVAAMKSEMETAANHFAELAMTGEWKQRLAGFINKT